MLPVTTQSLHSACPRQVPRAENSTQRHQTPNQLQQFFQNKLHAHFVVVEYLLYSSLLFGGLLQKE